MTCRAMVKPNCLEAQHQTRDLSDEAKECQTELEKVLKGFEKGDAMRNRVDGVLQAKLKAIEGEKGEYNNGSQKIQSAIVRCREIIAIQTLTWNECDS